MTQGQRALYLGSVFAWLVDNGGMTSFFTAAGFYSEDLEESLRLLGAEEMRELLVEGLGILTGGGEVLSDNNARHEIWYNLSDEDTNLLRSVNYDLIQDSGVEKNLFPYFKKYVDAHPEEFFRD
jgi:hypothetical protein